MPPKRKLGRASNLEASSPPASSPSQSDSQQPSKLNASAVKTQAPGAPTLQSLLDDPWTDEQEIALLKAIVRWKPVGMHKHFRMIAIKQYMDGQGCVNPEKDTHCSMPGIWEKLATWYNLPVLDEREDSILASPPQSPNPSVKPKSLQSSSTFQPFSLPPEFHDLMFERRLAPEGSKSPPLSALSRSRRGSTMQYSEEPRSSPATGSKGRRGGRSTRAAGRAAATAKREVEAEAEEEDADAEGQEASGDEEEEDEEEGSGDGGEQEQEEEEEDLSTRIKRRRSVVSATPSSSKTKAPAARGRARGRGRGRR